MGAAALSGVYNFVWRYVGFTDLRAFARANILSVSFFLALRLGLPERFQDWRIPISVILINAALAFGSLLTMRVVRRWDFERSQQSLRRLEEPPERVLLIGAGQGGVTAAREIRRHPEMGLQIAAFVDDDPSKVGTRIHDVPVIGTTDDLPDLLPDLEIERAIVTVGDASHADMRRIVEICESVPIRAQVIPDFHEVIAGKAEIRRVRDIAIEDLLGRQPVELDLVSLNDFLSGKHVWITGAGGSIGSELSRQVLTFTPARLTLVERSEAALFEIVRELGEQPGVTSSIADVGDRDRLDVLMSRGLPDVVFHAAAYKHVGLMESNVREAVRNNSLGTATLARCCTDHGVPAMVLISTDKAVRPSSVMGATKRIAELAVQALAENNITRFVAVRFGNVLGSTGSVVPIFRDQIDQGGPLTITHPDVERYFMTPSEAAQLVLQAGAIGESGEILILDMGEPVRIVDLAEDMIRLSGLKPHDDIAIEYIGLRPGEKLREELSLDREEMDGTQHPKIFIGRIDRVNADRLVEYLDHLNEICSSGTEAQLRQALASFLPEATLIAPRRSTGANVEEAAETV